MYPLSTKHQTTITEVKNTTKQLSYRQQNVSVFVLLYPTNCENFKWHFAFFQERFIKVGLLQLQRSTCPDTVQLSLVAQLHMPWPIMVITTLYVLLLQKYSASQGIQIGTLNI